MAELGAEPQNVSNANIDLKIENAFLKHVLEFEQNFAGAKRIKVYDRLGKPEFKKSAELKGDSIEQALKDILHCCIKKT